MRGSLWRIRLRVLGSTILMVGGILRGVGLMICKKGMEKRSGLMVLHTKESISRELRRERGNLSGLQEIFTLVNFPLTKYLAMESIIGLMAKLTKEIGETT